MKKIFSDRIIAVAGNPNVGKSTLFNALTGLKQHTGNWTGKTVENAQGFYTYKGKTFSLIDIPGTYSLLSSSEEEKIARDFICFDKPDITVVVVDATCIERNLNLVLQISEITKNVIVCINLLDEAKKKKIHIDLDELSLQLGGIPVVGTSARSKEGLNELMDTIYNFSFTSKKVFAIPLKYNSDIETAISLIEPSLKERKDIIINTRWLSIKLLDYDLSFINSLNNHLSYEILDISEIKNSLRDALNFLIDRGYSSEKIRDCIVETIFHRAESIYKACVFIGHQKYKTTDKKIDKILTSKLTGIPIMLFLLSVIFWITLSGANYPSSLISNFLFGIQDNLTFWFESMDAPPWLHGILVLGIYRTVAWVVAVMLPPMAIFFPLFTLLEDSGYLPRIAFNLDNFFKKAGAHGKQALTTCMGFGCNACGIIGCRIIDSPRERLIAILTNNFVPCNGRFPTLIAIIGMFFASNFYGISQSIISTSLLTAIVVIGIFTTFSIAKLLSKTLLKGIPSSFALELPPYRAPQICKTIVRSIFDRTLYVLGRAISVAAPAGLIIWVFANISINDISILSYCANFLNPFANLIGLDGVILMAFILGFPANEIVLPIMLMIYTSTGSMPEIGNLNDLKMLLINNGWTATTAICTMLFSIMHFPCGTSLLTIKKETQSSKWTLFAFLLPTLTGILCCFIVKCVSVIWSIF